MTDVTNPQTIFDDGPVREAYQKAHNPDRTIQSENNIIVGGWATAFFVPIVGFILGAILTTRQREGHGIWIMISSMLMAVLWYLLIAAIEQTA